MSNASPSRAREDPDAGRSSRRKACDLCFTKKIKCDMVRPVCSNCKLYDAQCRTSLLRRKANPPRPRPAAQAETQAASDTISSSNAAAPESLENPIESRLDRIERQLQRVLETPAFSESRPQDASNRTSAPENPSKNSDSSTDTASSGCPNIAHTTEPSASAHEFAYDIGLEKLPTVDDIQDVCATHGVGANDFKLPPRDKALPIIEHYFTNFNAIIPIFHQATFMRMFNDWYEYPSKQERASWAAIQIALASGLRTPRQGSIDSGFDGLAMANHCLRNAQSVVTELVTRDGDLLGMQVLLGIVYLFQNSSDSGPASVVISTAVRLAHRLEMQSLASQQYFKPEEVEQRSRVFWITYALDKDISLRAKTPSIQLDADIDIPLPAMVPLDGVGLIWTRCGRFSFNYHRMQVELAYIEGKVFDLLHSNRARNIKKPEREKHIQRLDAMLDQWYRCIPAPFRMESAASTLDPRTLLMLTKLYHAYLLAEVNTHGIFSMTAEWIQFMNQISPSLVENMALYKDNNAPRLVRTIQEAPRPMSWEKCVEMSRGCMKLFQNTLPTECLIWQSSCAHFSALIILLAEMIKNPAHPHVQVDELLTAKSLGLFDRMLAVVGEKSKLNALSGVIHELAVQANEAVDKSRKQVDVGLDAFSSGPEVYMFLENQGHQPFDEGTDNIDGPFGMPIDDFPLIGAHLGTDFGTFSENLRVDEFATADMPHQPTRI